MGFFGFGKKNKEKEQEKMKTGLEKTRTGFWGNILNTLTGSVIDDDMYDDLEEKLMARNVIIAILATALAVTTSRRK